VKEKQKEKATALFRFFKPIKVKKAPVVKGNL